MIENFASLDRPVLHSMDNVPDSMLLQNVADISRASSVYNVSKWDIATGNAQREVCVCGDSWACSKSLGDPNNPHKNVFSI